jgi:hypothetical protein
VQDLVELINVVTTLEERAATEKFRQNAAHRPDINYDVVNTGEGWIQGKGNTY